MAHVQNYVDTDAVIKHENEHKDNPENLIFVYDGINIEKIDPQTVEKEESGSGPSGVYPVCDEKCCKQIIFNDFYVIFFSTFVSIDVPILTELILP